MRNGRPKNVKLAKNRVRNIILSENAYSLFEKVSVARGFKGWLNKFVSDRIIEAFELDIRKFLKSEIKRLQNEKADFNRKIQTEIDSLILRYDGFEFSEEKQVEIILGGKANGAENERTNRETELTVGD